MAISEAYAGTEAVGATSHSLPNDGAFGSFITDDGTYQVFLDLSDMVAGDQLQIEFWETVGGTSTTFYYAILVGPQSPAIWVSPAFILTDGWDVILDALAGTVTVTWSIRKVV